MAERDLESGLELVLDNRKLIIAFAVLMALCGCCFVLGFIEGKRQGLHTGSVAMGPVEPKTDFDETPIQTGVPSSADFGARPSKESAGGQRLDWRNRIAMREEEPGRAQTAQGASSVAKAASPGAFGIHKSQGARSAPIKYSVQVGAFRQKREAEAKAKELRARGYQPRIEPPHPPEQLYLLKVGTFKSRADAVAVQLRLKKNGIASLIKAD